MAGHIRIVSKQVKALRDEEATEESWFELPSDGDDDVDWTCFVVGILGPVSWRDMCCPHWWRECAMLLFSLVYYSFVSGVYGACAA